MPTEQQRVQSAGARLRLIEMAEVRGDFLHEVDGYVYYGPSTNNGHLSSWMLRALADELDRRNAPWDAQINQYFEDHPYTEQPLPFDSLE